MQTTLIILIALILLLVFDSCRKEKYISPYLHSLQSKVNEGSLTNEYVETHPTFGRVTFPFYSVSPEDWKAGDERASAINVGSRGPPYAGIRHV